MQIAEQMRLGSEQCVHASNAEFRAHTAHNGRPSAALSRRRLRVHRDAVIA